MKLEILKSKSKEHWLELRGSDGCSEFKCGKEIPIWNVHVVCKWDGCVDYRSYSNGYSYDHECNEECLRTGCVEDYIHICSVDNFIEQLQAIKSVATGYYKGKWGEEYWEVKKASPHKP